MRTVPFSQLFSFDESSQTITPRVAVRIDGATFTPGVSIGRGIYVSRGGVALRALVGMDLKVNDARGVPELHPQQPSAAACRAVPAIPAQLAANTSSAATRKSRSKAKTA
jgi:hypothetical protein